MAFFADHDDGAHGLRGVVQSPLHVEGVCQALQLGAQIVLADGAARKLHAHEKQTGVVVVVLRGFFDVALTL